MSERRCAVVGCATFPDASWDLCAEHLAQIEAEIDADYAAQESGDPLAEPCGCVHSHYDGVCPEPEEPKS